MSPVQQRKRSRYPVRVVSASELTDQDLRMLTLWSGDWGPDVHAVTDEARLWENVSDAGQPIPTHFPRAYWVGDRWEVVCLLRSYFRFKGCSSTTLWDNGDEPAPGYVILTAYRPQ